MAQAEDNQAVEDAEMAVLASCLIDPDCLAKVRPILGPEDFLRPRNGWIYRAMLRIADKGVGGNPEVRTINEITVAYELSLEQVPSKKTQVRDGEWVEQRQPGQPTTFLGLVGGAAYLSHIIAEMPTCVFAEDYAQIVKDGAIKRSGERPQINGKFRGKGGIYVRHRE